ncbi:drug/metabolite transporter (DMT)-like permease [Bradyrhizobium sp. LB7.1]
MDQRTSGADALTHKNDAAPALLGVVCGLAAALFWALGFAGTRHGLKVGFTPVDLLVHRYVWSGIAFLPLVMRAGVGDLCGIGWGRGLVLMVLGGPVMSLISYTGFLFVPLGHGSVIQPSCATLGGLLLAALFLKEHISASRLVGAFVIVGGLGVIRRGIDRPYRRRRRAG